MFCEALLVPLPEPSSGDRSGFLFQNLFYPFFGRASPLR